MHSDFVCVCAHCGLDYVGAFALAACLCCSMCVSSITSTRYLFDTYTERSSTVRTHINNIIYQFNICNICHTNNINIFNNI